MQIKGEEFIKKVQLQQEREELERKLSELEEVQMSINNNEPTIVERDIIEPIVEHELDNIMLGASNGSNEDNKKKYLVLGIVLVVLFLLTIIIIRLLTDDSNIKTDQFTSNNQSSSDVKKLSENSNIEENFQKIINERVKKESSEPMIPENEMPEKVNNTQEQLENLPQTVQEDAPAGITNETLDETIKKVEQKKTQKPLEKTVEKTPVSKTVEKQTEETVKKPVEKKVVEPKKSVKDLIDTPSESVSSGDVSSGYFIQIGAFTKKPTDSYINTIRSAKFKYKVFQDEVKGVTYNKVLIGPYSSKAAASENVESVKEKLNVTSAFVVKF